MVAEKLDKTDHILINISGSLDVNSSLEVDTMLDEAIASGMKKVVVNCEALEYITSPGIGVFTSKIGDCEKSGITLSLVGMNERVYGVFKVLGLDKIIPITKSTENSNQYIDELEGSDSM